MPSPKRITFLGELAPHTGYGQHSAVLIKALQDAGYFVSIRPLRTHPGIPAELASLFVHCPQPEEWEIILSPPCRDVTPGKRTIYYTMWESTQLPAKAVELLNKCEAVLVPSAWNKFSFEACGVHVPIHIVPLGVDPAVYPYRAPSKGPAVFGAAGNLRNGAKRKGLSESIKAFQMAFPTNNRVRLQVKVAGWLGDLEVNDDRIEVQDKPMSDQELSWWYGRCHCFISMAKAEGWGLMQLQAMATGRPVIAAPYGGLGAFLDERVGYPTFWKEKPAEETWSGLGKWAEPNLEHATLLLRHVYENPEEATALGHKASERAHALSWRSSADHFLSIVEDVCR